jgi:CheY-like chemotaxis protein
MPEDAPPIVIVDDDRDFLIMMRDVLQAAGYRVISAPDPAAAIEAMAREKPRLVVTDLMMKALDSGFSLARTVKEDPRLRDVPVIVVTGVAAKLGLDFTPRGLADLAAMRADAFFQKPVLPGELLAKIGELLGHRARDNAQ